MARLFITGFATQGSGVIGVVGFVHDAARDIYIGLTIDNIPIDTASSTSVRQQVQDGMVAAANAQLVASAVDLVLIASDVEYVC